MSNEVLNLHLITKEVTMITINPIKITTIKPITFGNDNNSRVGLMNLDKNPSNKIKH